MNDSEEEISYWLFKKGKKNFTAFDKLLIESNPEIKERIQKLSEVSSETYLKAIKRTEEMVELEKKAADKKRRLISYVSIPAAACFLIFFTFIYQNVIAPSHYSMDGANLYITRSSEPRKLSSKGDFFEEGEEIKLAFQPDTELIKIKQGILFSVDNNLESTVYYRYDKKSGSLKQNSSTQIEPVIRLKKDIEYIYFFIVLSDSAFDEKEQIKRVKQIIEKKKLKADRLLIKELKDTASSYIYLRKKR